MRRIVWVLLAVAVIGATLFVYEGHKGAREAKEASMFSFLCMQLRLHKDRVGEYPETIGHGIEQGLLEHFPVDRIGYFREAYEDGRFQYTRSLDGGFTLRMTFGDRALYGDENASGRWEDSSRDTNQD
jgi:hypothetical protein